MEFEKLLELLSDDENLANWLTNYMTSQSDATADILADSDFEREELYLPIGTVLGQTLETLILLLLAERHKNSEEDFQKMKDSIEEKFTTMAHCAGAGGPINVSQEPN